MGEYAAIAREKDEKWYISTISNHNARTVSIPLDFLDNSIDYAVTIYTDKKTNTINKQVSTISTLEQSGTIENNSIDIDLWANGGAVLVFDPDNTLDIIDNLNSPKLSIYPNPSTGIVTCELNKVYNKVEINVYSVTGELMKTKYYSGMDKITIDLSNLPEGLYIISTETGNKKFINKLLLKQ